MRRMFIIEPLWPSGLLVMRVQTPPVRVGELAWGIGMGALDILNRSAALVRERRILDPNPHFIHNSSPTLTGGV
jgi:hypothetical protein